MFIQMRLISLFSLTNLRFIKLRQVASSRQVLPSRNLSVTLRNVTPAPFILLLSSFSHFPKSQMIHIRQHRIFFDNDEIRNGCLYPSKCDCIDECEDLEELSSPAIYGRNYTYAYVQSNVAPYRSITGIAVDLTASAGLQRRTYSERQAKHEEMERLWESVNALNRSKKTQPDNPA